MVILVKEENPSPDGVCGGESSQSHLPNPISEKNQENPDEKIDFPEMGIDFSRESEMGCDDFKSKPSKTGDSVSLDLTLSHLCENPKLVFPPNERNLRNSFEKVVCEYQNQENNGLIERDFLRWNEVNVNTSKRQVVEDEEIDGDNREKKPKLETLNLSLALSLFLAAASNPIPTSQTTNTNTQTTYSTDFTAASSSYSCPHPFSDNPSSSLTCYDTTESYEYSVGSSGRDCEHIWNGGEGTNGSVDSRFRLIGDGVALSNHGGGSFPLMQGNRAINNDSYNSFYLATSSNNHSFFPSTLQASENVIGVESLDGGRARKLSRPEGIIQEVVSESILVMSQGIQELPDEALESLKKYLKKLIATPERKEELVSLQKKLEGRSYLNKETLSKTSIKHLEILVSVKMGLGSFLSSENRILAIELVEIFLLERCQNINCMSALPVDDCDCMICSTKKGFCSECICLVCLNFDCAKDTCSWVGCDVCSHWCHAACGLQRNLIKPGPSLDGPSGTTEMQFHCLGCGYASEMFGFVKDLFMSCAKDWDLETLMKELDCVREIFQWSEDFKGKKLHVMADRMLFELESKSMSPSHVCNFILQFFDCPILTLNSLSLNTYVPNPSSSNGRHALHQSNLNTFLMGDNVIEDDMWAAMLSKEYGFDLESFVQFKEAEARMYQTRADKVRRESENYSRIVQMESDRLEEEYAKKLTILCLQETEELRRKKLEHLKNLEDAYMDYYKLMAIMQAEIASLLERMEATRQRRE